MKNFLIRKLARWLPVVKAHPDLIKPTCLKVKEVAMATHGFLFTLRKVGEFKYRKNIPLSDVQLAEFLDNNTISILGTIREYIMMQAWIGATNNMPEFQNFRMACQIEIDKMLKDDAEAAKRSRTESVTQTPTNSETVNPEAANESTGVVL